MGSVACELKRFIELIEIRGIKHHNDTNSLAYHIKLNIDMITEDELSRIEASVVEKDAEGKEVSHEITLDTSLVFEHELNPDQRIGDVYVSAIIS